MTDPQLPVEIGRKIASILNGFSVAAKTVRLYQNPLEQPAFSRAMALVRDGLGEGERFRLRVLPDRFTMEGGEIGRGDEVLSPLAHTLYDKGIAELTIMSEPLPHELLGLAALIAGEAEEIEEEGGPASFLDRRDVASIKVSALQVEVGEFTPLALSELPERIRDLLAQRREFAKKLEAEMSPAEAYERLRELLSEALELSIDVNEVHGAIADTIAAMSPAFRAAIVEIAIEGMPDPFAQMVVSQLTDGDLAESLTSLSQNRPLDLVMAYAQQVVANSGGRRPELPVIVGRQLLEIGLDREQILSAFGTSRMLGDSATATALPTEALTLRSAEEELALGELRAEARMPSPEFDLEYGGATLEALLEVVEKDEDFEELVVFAEDSIRRWTREGNREWYINFLDVLVKQSKQQPIPERAERLRHSVGAVATQELVTDLLRADLAGGDLIGRTLELIGSKFASALAQQLWEEPDGARRKTLIEMLSKVAPSNPQPLIQAVTDSRWYVVRNALHIIGRAKVPVPTEVIASVLEHPDARVRREAARAAATAGAEAIPALDQALGDADESVRMAVVAALGSLRDPAATRSLINFFSRRALRTVRELKETLNSLHLNSTPEALSFLESISRRKWPPTATTRQLARHAKSILSRDLPPREPS